MPRTIPGRGILTFLAGFVSTAGARYAGLASMVPCVTEHAGIQGSLEARDKDRAIDLIEPHLSSAHERMMRIPLEE